MGVFAYQWQSKSSGDWSDIAGATGQSYEIVKDNIGQNLRLTISYTDDEGTEESVISAITSNVVSLENNEDVRRSDNYDSSREKLTSFNIESPSGTLNFNSGSYLIMLDGSSKTYRGLKGDDTYILSDLMNCKINRPFESFFRLILF